MPTYTIDDDTLRETVDDPEFVRARIRDLEALGSDGDIERLGWLRIIGELDAAEAIGRELLSNAGGSVRGPLPLPPGAILPALRLGHVLHWQGRFDEAADLMKRALSAAEGEADSPRMRLIRAFAHQHLGKLQFDQGDLSASERSFRAALALREASQAPADQIASSRQALAAVNRQRAMS